MGARWYNPSAGQFNNADTATNSPSPLSVNANRYTYADDSPLDGADPSGHFDAEEGAAIGWSAPDPDTEDFEGAGGGGGDSYDEQSPSAVVDDNGDITIETSAEMEGDDEATGIADEDESLEEARDRGSEATEEDLNDSSSSSDSSSGDWSSDGSSSSDSSSDDSQSEEQNAEQEREEEERAEEEKKAEEERAEEAKKAAEQKATDERDAKANRYVGKSEIDKGATGSDGGDGKSASPTEKVAATPDVTVNEDVPGAGQEGDGDSNEDSLFDGKPYRAPWFDGHTRGILEINDEEIELNSRGPNPRNYIASGHVEGQAALMMRAQGITSGVLRIDNPSGICNYCVTQVPTLLEGGSILEVQTPLGTVPRDPTWSNSRIFIGNPLEPRSPS